MKKIILCIAMTMYSLQFVAQIKHQQSYFNFNGASVDNRGLCKSTANDGYMVVPDGAKRTNGGKNMDISKNACWRWKFLPDDLEARKTGTGSYFRILYQE